ncbi:MAG: aminotransferase class I/II-fold pyridoxal phosphate-dependent enzyme, partial [Desulfitobacterium sp.]|nr:aminotransferase class I/II-fold pyridoxal phosphate-dependent enzyme [Desulfitobacterium sp.]
AFANPPLLKELKKYRDPWSVNVLAQEAGMAALQDEKYPSYVRKLLWESKEEFFKNFSQSQLKKLDLHPSTTNFALISLKDVETDKEKLELLQQLGEQGILLRDCYNFRGLEKGYLRTAIKDKSSMEALLKGLEKWEKEN